MSNHNGNANKMVDTPRTDEQECDMFVGVSTFTPSDIQQAFDFARQLERELNAANDKIEQLEDNRTKAAANSLANMLAYEDAIAKIKELEEWKESALAVEREWDANAIATMLGGRLGESQREVIQREVPKLLDRIKRLEGIGKWIPANAKPEGYERKVLLWIVWPSFGAWCDSPEPLIGWWKHGPKCFALGDIENADHLTKYWMELPEPSESKEAKP